MLEFSALQENLALRLAMVGRAVSSKPIMPITTAVLLTQDNGRLKLSCTDLDIAITAWSGASFSMMSSGAVAVPWATFTGIVSKLPPTTVSIREDGGKLHISTPNGFKAEVSTFPPDEFPQVANTTAGVSVEVSAMALREAIEYVQRSAAANDTRPVLTGVNVQEQGGCIQLATADGFRLGLAEIPEAPLGWPASVVPVRAMREVGRLAAGADRLLRVESNETNTAVDISDDAEGWVVHASLIQSTFPDYTRLIPQESPTVRAIVSRHILRDTVRVMRTVDTHVVRIMADGGVLRMSVADENGGTKVAQEVEAKVAGDGRIAANIRYLEDALASLPDEPVALEWTTPQAQMKILPAGRAYPIQVIMPMFVQW